jgi:Fe-S cluster assembly protein SufD
MPRLVFSGGRFREELSTPIAGFVRFADQPDFGELSWPDRDPMVALNTMLAEDGAVLTIPADRDAGLILLINNSIDGTSAHPRHMIRLEHGARLTLVERSEGDGCYVHNPVTEIHVADGATLTHVRIQTESTDAFHLATIYAAVAAGGTARILFESALLVIPERVKDPLGGLHDQNHENRPLGRYAQCRRGEERRQGSSLLRAKTV